MKSANQLYRESNTTKTFKEWLNEQKMSGMLPNNNENEKIMYHNASDETKPKVQVFGIDVKYIAIGVILLGATYIGYRYWKKRQ